MRSRTATRLLATVAVLALMASACGGDDDDTTTQGGTDSTAAGVLSGASFTVGSKEFTEQLILGQITIQVLEDAGANGERRDRPGGVQHRAGGT